MTAKVQLVTDDALSRHLTGPGHPERPERLLAILAMLSERPVAGTAVVAPRSATDEALARVHDRAHLAALAGLRGRAGWIDPDTPCSPESVDLARLAAGAVTTGIDAVHHGEAGAAFALVRPPGHHAETGRAMGFCLLANLAIGAAHAIEALGYERVLVVDWDVHHGNGTAHVFEADPRVLVFDVHQHPLYPGTGFFNETGRGAGEGYTVNVPLAAGAGDADCALVFERVLGPVAGRFRPQLVLVSAGYDAHADDPLGSMRLSDDGFAHLASVVRGIAERHAGGKLVAALEGGYDVDALARSVRRTVEAFAGAEAPHPEGEVRAETKTALEFVRRLHGARWGC